MGGSLLQVEGLSKSFAGVRAVDEFSFSVEEGSVTALIGPNGSGKSTTIDCISGFTRADAGRVILGGKDITGAAPHAVATAGLIRTFQNVRVYERFSLRDNLRMAAGGVAATDPLQFARARDKAPSTDVVDQLLNRVGLKAYREAPAAILSYGQRKLLALAAALISNPAIIILDEPLAGVNPSIIRDLSKLLDELKEERQTLVIIEHHIPFVMRHCGHVVVLEAGRKLTEGTPATVRADERVMRAYLGGAPGETVMEKVA